MKIFPRLVRLPWLFLKRFNLNNALEKKNKNNKKNSINNGKQFDMPGMVLRAVYTQPVSLSQSDETGPRIIPILQIQTQDRKVE